MYNIVMASGPELDSSVLIEDYFSSSLCPQLENTAITSTPSKENYLICHDKIFLWKGCLDSLKEFVCNELGLHGHWISPGGQVKEFASSCKGYALKWQGKTRNKLAVIRDDDERSLTAKLKRLASSTKD
jgi:hypothetical protein